MLRITLTDRVPRMARFITIAALIGCLLGVATRTAAAQEVDNADSQGGVSIEGVHVGFAKQAQVGHWVPIRVVLSGAVEGCSIEVTVPDGDGLETVYREQPTDVKASDRFVYVKLGRRRGELGVKVLDADGRAAAKVSYLLERDVTLHVSTRESVLCLSPPDAKQLDLDKVFRRFGNSSNERPVAYHVSDPATLPDEWIGYASIDVIVLTTSRSGLLDQMSDRQRNALEMWVRLGGRLILSTGQRAKEIASLSSIGELLPGPPTELVDQQRAVGMEEYVVQTSEPLPPYPIALFGDSDARVLASERSLTGKIRPVILRKSHGMGVVTTVATDLDLPPFVEWESLSEVFLKLLRLDDAKGGGQDRQGSIGRISHIGYEDLSGQLRAMLDRFTGPDGGSVMIAFSPVAACLALYILLIAPGDYFLLRRMLGRMELTWITFPLMVGLACGAIFWAASMLKRNDFSLNQFDVVDFDHTTSTMRGYTFASCYSPATASHTIHLENGLELSLQEGGGDAEQSGNLLSWMGLPGQGLGGLNTSTGAAFDQPYGIEIDAERTSTLKDIPLAIASTKQLQGVWWRTRVDGGEVNLSRKREYVQGEFANPFPVEIRDGLLFYNDWVYVLRRRVLPEQTISIAEMEEPRDLVWRLTRRRVIDQKSNNTYENTPWDPTDESANRMMEMMTLYQIAGGKAYTQLTHRYLDQFDWSEHLANGRAVFIGRVSTPVAQLVENGKPLDDKAQRWTFCRAILPVQEPTSE